MAAKVMTAKQPATEQLPPKTWPKGWKVARAAQSLTGESWTAENKQRDLLLTGFESREDAIEAARHRQNELDGQTKSPFGDFVSATGPTDPETANRAQPGLNGNGSTRTEYAEISLGQLRPCPLNPRKYFDQAKLDELASSIKAQGLLEPLIVRRLINTVGLTPGILPEVFEYQVLAGERRYRAAKQIELESVPCRVVEASDEEALNIMLIENHQREPLKPLEQARTFELMAKRFNRQPKEIAEHQGVSESLVHKRLTLLRLNKDAQKALDEEKLSIGAAYALAWLNDDKQRNAATKEILSWLKWESHIDTKRVTNHIKDRYLLDLSKAGWKLGDETLLPEMGPCTKCPHRTGANPNLFGELKGKNLCTNAPCFEQKKARHNQRKLDEVKQQGIEILAPAESKHLFSYGSLNYNAPYVEADDSCRVDPKYYKKKDQTWQKVVKDEVQPVAALDDKGNVKLLYPRKEAEKVAIAKLGLTGINPRTGETKADRKRKLLEEKANRLAELEFLRQVIEKARTMAPVPAMNPNLGERQLWRAFLLEQIGHIYHDTLKLICAVLGIEKPERKKDKHGYTMGPDWRKLIEKYLDGKDEAYCYGVIIAESAYRQKSSYVSDKTLHHALGVDFAKIKADQLRTLKEQLKEKTTKAKAKPAAKVKPKTKRAEATV